MSSHSCLGKLMELLVSLILALFLVSVIIYLIPRTNSLFYPNPSDEFRKFKYNTILQKSRTKEKLEEGDVGFWWPQCCQPVILDATLRDEASILDFIGWDQYTVKIRRQGGETRGMLFVSGLRTFWEERWLYSTRYDVDDPRNDKLNDLIYQGVQDWHKKWRE